MEEHQGGSPQGAVRRVRMGVTVRVLDVVADEEDEYVIVSPVEADVTRGRLSTESPVGRSLLGRAPGEEIPVQTPGGVRRLIIVEVSDAGAP
jgi:transcription elongation factor GreA